MVEKRSAVTDELVRSTVAAPGGSGRAWRDRLLVADPGLSRLRMATSGAVAVSVAIGAERLFRLTTGGATAASLVAMLLGAVVAMQATMGFANATSLAGRLRLAPGYPIAVSLGLTAGALVAGRGGLAEGIFVVVQFAAVLVRRFGPAFFVYGFMGWMGYFFASFLQTPPAGLPPLLEDVAVAAVVATGLALTLLRARPRRTLGRLLEAMLASCRRSAATAAELLAGGGPTAADRLDRRLVRLTETALLVDAILADAAAVPVGWSPATLRRWILELQLATEQLVAGALQLARCCDHLDRRERAVLGATERLLRATADGDLAHLGATADALALAGGAGERPPSLACALAGRLALTARHLTDVLAGDPRQGGPPPTVDPATSDPVGADDEAFEPAVQLAMGGLPAFPPVAREVTPRSWRRNPLRGTSLVTRQAIQAALSAGLAVVAGAALSPARYYWAVIASFVVFAGTATRAETITKGAARLAGTVAGIAASLVVADATLHDTPAILAVIVASMFLALYTQRVSYTLMVLFITVMLGELYGVLDLLSDHLLLLRLEETGIGAGLAVAVSVVFLPLSTADTARAARAAFLSALAGLLEGCAARLTGEPEAPSSAALDDLARRLDARYHDLDLVLRPRARSSLLGGDPGVVRERLGRYLLTTGAARELATAVRAGHPVRPNLARACRRLAATCSTLAAPDVRPSRAELRDELTEAAAALGDARIAAVSGPALVELAGDPLEHAAARVLLALGALVGGGAGTPALAALRPPGSPRAAPAPPRK